MEHTKRIWQALASVPLYAVLVVLFVPSIRRAAEAHTELYWGYLFLCAFLLSFLVMPYVINLGFKLGAVDRPDADRKHHEKATPVTGGVAIYIGFAVTVLVNFHFSVEMKAILVASTLILAVGVIDDRFGIPARIRLLVQLVASLILIYFGVRVTFVPPWLGGVYTETLITLVWLIG
ncbi:MAG: hypothetical protein GF410_13540, partial [Chitinivibrionales bacterium]|nr:hypothetical protein [Chitinivibrionales bacterium]